MPFVKRPWNYYDLDEDDEDDNNSFQLPSSKRPKSHSLTYKRRPLGDSNTGLISPPVTPEKNRIVTATLSKSSPTVRKLNLQAEAHSPYTQAKKLFLRGCTNNLPAGEFVLPGREAEAKLLKGYIEKALVEVESTSIYVSGPPGTGKTAQVNAILDSLTQPGRQNSAPGSNIYQLPLVHNGHEVNRKFRVVKINCMTMTSAEGVFQTLLQSITHKDCSAKSAKQDQVRKLLEDRTHCDMTILVLDEMDSIISKDQQTLFELFSWASTISSKDGSASPNLVLIGIANALDLTDRFLPRLRSNCINPRIVQVLPYTAGQIEDVIKAKLRSLDENTEATGLPPIVHPTAIKLCAKKAAVNTGDLRKAFDIIHRSIEVVEEATMKRLPQDQFETLTPASAPKVMISQVARVCSAAFNTDYAGKLESLNLQSKTLLCCLFSFEDRQNEPAPENIFKGGKKPTTNRIVPSINNFFEFYTKHLKSVDRMLTALKRGEFLEVLTTLESNSLVNLTQLSDNSSRFKTGVSRAGGNTKRMISFGNYKISANVPKAEFVKHIKNIEILRKILTA